MSENVRDAVRQGYGAVARSGLSTDQDGISAIARAFGYSAEELSSIPAEANMGLSCGNPVAMASIKPGEVVVDLGSGGGIDVFLAAQKVGPEGRAIGIDMTQDMVALARRNAEKQDLSNVEFHLAEIENMPLESDSVDCVISNCVLNLVADKDKAVAEIYRVLKPGGRLAISDIVLKKPLAPEIKNSSAGWVSCISGAISFDDNRACLEAAGFQDIEIIDSNSDLNAYRDGGGTGCCSSDVVVEAEMETSSCCGGSSPSEAQAQPEAAPEVEPEAEKSSSSCCGGGSAESDNSDDAAAYHDRMVEVLDQFDFNEYAASAKIFAVKPAD